MQNKYWANEQWNNLAPEVTLESIGAAPEVLTAITAPTTATVGAVGQFYLNTATTKVYQCLAVAGSVYTWKEVTPFTVGAICSTIASSLGSDWALANGDEVVQATYPALYSLLPSSAIASTYTKISADLQGPILYFKGLYIKWKPDDTGYKTASALGGTWTSRTAPVKLSGMKVMGNYLVVFGLVTGYTYYAYSSDGITWSSTISLTNLRDMDYAGGVYMAICYDGNSAASYYSNDITNLVYKGQIWALTDVATMYYANNYVVAINSVGTVACYWTLLQFSQGVAGTVFYPSVSLGAGTIKQVIYDSVNDVWAMLYLSGVSNYTSAYQILIDFSPSTPASFGTNAKRLLVDSQANSSLPSVAPRYSPLATINGVFYVTLLIGNVTYLYSCVYGIERVERGLLCAETPCYNMILSSETPARFIMSCYTLYVTGLKHLPMRNSPSEHVFIKVT